MKHFNLPLAVGIALPIVFIIILVFVLYVPSLSLQPKYDFVYASEQQDGYPYERHRFSYDVEQGTIVMKENPAHEDYPFIGETPELYRYDVENESSHRLTFEEAQALTLDPGPSSPDGYTVGYQSHYASGFFFGGGGENGYALQKGGAGKYLNGLVTNNRFSTDLHLVGWIIE